MADTKKATDSSAESPKKADASSVKKGGKRGRIRPRNYDLGNGVYRFSRTRMFHKKAIYKFIGKKTPKTVRYVAYGIRRCLHLYLMCALIFCNRLSLRNQ